MYNYKTIINEQYNSLKEHRFLKHFRKYKEEALNEFLDVVKENYNNEAIGILEFLYLRHSLYLNSKNEKYRYYGNSLKRALKKYLSEAVDFVDKVKYYVLLILNYEKAECSLCNCSGENMFMTEDYDFLCHNCYCNI